MQVIQDARGVNGGPEVVAAVPSVATGSVVTDPEPSPVAVLRELPSAGNEPKCFDKFEVQMMYQQWTNDRPRYSLISSPVSV